MCVQIGDQVVLNLAVKAIDGSNIVWLPAGAIGTLEERDADNWYHFVTERNGQRVRTWVAGDEVRRTINSK